MLAWTTPVHAAWESVMEMKTARSHHSATLLHDGSVLVAGGGTDNDGVTSSVELYDPSTGTWRNSMPLHIGRKYHSATLLSDGRVLVAGGRMGVGRNARALSSVEIYDPSSSTWSVTGRLTFAREWHAASLLADGRVLIAGGKTKNGGRLKSAEIYNPSTGTWSITGLLINPRSIHTAVRLMNGKVLMTGDTANKWAEIYDPSTGNWSNTGVQNWSRRLHTATLLRNGKVLVAGGRQVNKFIKPTEIYDPETGKWNTSGVLNISRYLHTATLLVDGQVMLTGGGGKNGVQKSVEFYDPSFKTWNVGETMRKPRSAHTATRLKNEKVIVSGGIGNAGRRNNHAELYLPENTIGQLAERHTVPPSTPYNPVQAEQPAATPAVSALRQTIPSPPSTDKAQDKAKTSKKATNKPARSISGSQRHQAIKSTTITEAVELKSEADIFSETLAELPVGAKVVINTIEGDWAYASVNDQKGYIYTEFLDQSHHKNMLHRGVDESFTPAIKKMDEKKKKRDEKKTFDEYISQIRSKITRNWRKPIGTQAGLITTLRVKLLHGGSIAEVTILRTSGNPAYDHSAKEAVLRASPLPVPAGREFDKFRNIRLRFSPTGIR